MHSNWRDCDAWRKENLSMNTVSNEAAKLYDVNLTQIVGFYEDPNYDGLLNTLNNMIAADDNFILGHCLKTGISLMNSNVLLNSKDSLQNVQLLVDKANKLLPSLTKREIMHVKATEMLQLGDLPNAAKYYEDILIDHPTDIMALSFAMKMYFYLGDKFQLRNSVARVLPHWKKSMPLYGYLYGMHAFGLSQSNMLDLSEKTAFKALDLNKYDIWATHGICHVNEYRSSFENGIRFLERTESDWSKCSMLKSHNYWHLSLFHLEANNHERVLEIFDNQLLNTYTAIDLINSSSLLMRMKIDSYPKVEELSKRWTKIKDNFSSRFEEHGYMYTDVHTALLLGTCGSPDEKNKFINSLNEHLTSEDFSFNENSDTLSNALGKKISPVNYLKQVNSELAEKVFKSIYHLENKEYDEVVDLLYPLRHELYKIGGSNAQLDIFNLILIYAGLNCTTDHNKKIGVALINERLINKPDSDLTQRIAARFNLASEIE